MFFNITANLSAKVRRETLNGREHLVAPATLMVPGVMNGNRGPILYTKEEINKAPDNWNHMPIVIDHPFTEDGEAVSARTPDILNESGIGVVLSASVNGKLSAELWFDVENLERIRPDLLSRLEGGQAIELSTGLRLDQEDTQGTFDSVAYQSIARNFRPDHLAILPDKTGACSIADGCGVLNERHLLLIGFTKRKQGHIHSVRVDESGNGFVTLVDGHSHQVVEFKVLETDGHTHTIDKTSLVDPGANNSLEDDEMKEKAKKKIVDNLIANGCGCWDEEDREVLNEFSDDKLTALDKYRSDHEKIVTNAEKSDAIAKSATAGFETDSHSNTWNAEKGEWESKKKEPKKEGDKVENKETAPKSKTREEYMAEMPADMRETVNNAMAWDAEQKAQCIKTIIANEKFGFTAEALASKKLPELQILARAAAPDDTPVPAAAGVSYAGQASGGTPVGNMAGTPEDFDEEDGLPLPVINWNEKQDA